MKRKRERAAELSRLIQKWIKNDRGSIRTLASVSSVPKGTVEKAYSAKGAISLEPTLKILVSVADTRTALLFIRQHLPALQKFLELRDQHLTERRLTAQRQDPDAGASGDFAAAFEIPGDACAQIFVGGKTAAYTPNGAKFLSELIMILASMLLNNFAEQLV